MTFARLHISPQRVFADRPQYFIFADQWANCPQPAIANNANCVKCDDCAADLIRAGIIACEGMAKPLGNLNADVY